MLRHLSYDKENMENLALSLVKFFNEVDVNGDGDLTWVEFSNYVIEIGNHCISGLILDTVDLTDKIKPYILSKTVWDRYKHEDIIEKVQYLDKLKQILIINKDESKFKIINYINGIEVAEVKTKLQVQAHKTPILATEYIYDLGLIATHSNDLTINFWDQATYQLRNSITVPEIQLIMKYVSWSATQKILYVGSSDATLRYYDLLNLKEKGIISTCTQLQKKNQNINGHFGAITDILAIPSQKIMATCSLDKKICIWDFPSHQFKKDFIGHEKGIYSLEWSEHNFQNACLLSAGFEHDVFIWNTYVKNKIYQLKGHQSPLLGVRCMQGTPQVISVDISGVIKVTYLKRFGISETIKTLSRSVQMRKQIKKIILGNRRIQYFDYDEIKDQNICDEYPCIKVIFSRELAYFITIHPYTVKIWNPKGKILNTHNQKPSRELIGGCIDSRQLKLFLITIKGTIFTINIKNGQKMRKYQKHQGQINFIQVWNSNGDQVRRIITSSKDGLVNVHDEDILLENYTVVFQLKSNVQQNCTTTLNNLCMCGADNGEIMCLNLEINRQDHFYQHDKAIKALVFLNPHKVLATVDSQGLVMFFTLSFNQKVLCKKQGLIWSPYYNKLVNLQPTCVIYFDQENMLIIADESGHVTFWTVKSLTLKNGQIKKSHTFDEIKKDELELTKEELDEHLKNTALNLNNSKEEIQEEYQEQTLQKVDQQQLQKDDEEFLKNFNKKSILTSKDLSQVKNKKKQQNNGRFIPHDKLHEYFNVDDDIYELKVLKCHSEAITSIQLLNVEKSLITSSYDFCVHIWSLKDFTKLGSLTSAENNSWKVVIDVREKEEKDLLEVKTILSKINFNDGAQEQNENESGDENKSETQIDNEILQLKMKEENDKQQERENSDELAKQNHVKNKKSILTQARASLQNYKTGNNSNWIS